MKTIKKQSKNTKKYPHEKRTLMHLASGWWVRQTLPALFKHLHHGLGTLLRQPSS
jgi:hypothetical protein